MKSTSETLEQLEQTAGVDKQLQARNVSDGIVGDDNAARHPQTIPALTLGACKIHAQWLVGNDLLLLVNEMMRLSQAYDFPWAASWQHHLDNPAWLGRAMAQTVEHLQPQDQQRIRPLYDDWLWYENHIDMQALVAPEFNALCYILDGKGKRICNDQGEVTVLRGLKGPDKQEALKTLDKRYYEFKAWW